MVDGVDSDISAAVGAGREREFGVQYPGFWGESDAQGADAGDLGVVGAEEYLPELAGGFCVWAGGGGVFVVDYGYCLSGFCG